MSTKTNKLGDVSSLLGVMSAKQASGEIKKSPLQTVQPVSEPEKDNKSVLELKNKNSKTLKHENITQSTPTGKVVGRPSTKKGGVEYVKISPTIPKDLKKQIGLVLLEERFTDGEGKGITTLDELVTLALEKLIKTA